MAEWVLSPLAAAELQEILDHIAAESGSADIADKVAEDFSAALSTLAGSPGIGWVRDRLTGPGIRWWQVHSYLIAYSPQTKPLRVIRILHGARDLESLLRKEP